RLDDFADLCGPQRYPRAARPPFARLGDVPHAHVDEFPAAVFGKSDAQALAVAPGKVEKRRAGVDELAAARGRCSIIGAGCRGRTLARAAALLFLGCRHRSSPGPIIQWVGDPRMDLGQLVEGTARAHPDWLRGLAFENKLTPLLAAYANKFSERAPSPEPRLWDEILGRRVRARGGGAGCCWRFRMLRLGTRCFDRDRAAEWPCGHCYVCHCCLHGRCLQ